MTLDLQEMRPPVIQKNVATQLDEYRKFRHRVRNIYATSLDPARMQPLVISLPDLWSSIKRDLLAFLEFLDELARTD